MTRHVEAMLAAVVALGCSGASGGRADNSAALAAEREVVAWHAAWRAGPTGFASGFSPGGLFIGTDPAGPRVGRQAIADRAGDLALAAGEAAVVGLDAGGHAAWIADVASVEGRAVRRTVVLERD